VQDRNLFSIIHCENSTPEAKALKPKGRPKRQKGFITPKKGIFYLYFLKCQHRWDYVGVTKNWRGRIKEHIKGEGAKFTRRHSPIKVIGVWRLGELNYSEAEEIEDNFTLEMMAKHKGRVRGGHFLEEKLKPEELLKCYVVQEGCIAKYERINVPMDMIGSCHSIASKQKTKAKRAKISRRCKDKQVAKMLGLKGMSFDEAVDTLYDYWVSEGELTKTRDCAEKKILQKGWYIP